jgi:heterodisulfide reductase subunit C
MTVMSASEGTPETNDGNEVRSEKVKSFIRWSAVRDQSKIKETAGYGLSQTPCVRCSRCFLSSPCLKYGRFGVIV